MEQYVAKLCNVAFDVNCTSLKKVVTQEQTEVTMKHKTKIERVYNEDTGWFETREVELNSYSFTDDDRIMIVREYMESGLPAEEIIKKYLSLIHI